MIRSRSKTDLLTIAHGRIFDKPTLEFRSKIAPILGISPETSGNSELTATDILYEVLATTFTLEMVDDGTLKDETTFQRVSDEIYRLVRMTENLRSRGGL